MVRSKRVLEEEEGVPRLHVLWKGRRVVCCVFCCLGNVHTAREESFVSASTEDHQFQWKEMVREQSIHDGERINIFFRKKVRC